MNKTDISVCIIAKNESEMIRDCLASVAPIAEEIIVVDTGSTDNTKDIAYSFGAKVIDCPWENDFSKARNRALDAARCKYILSIDADERLLNPFELQNTLEKASHEVGGWLLKVTSEAKRGDGGTDVYVANLLRVFLNRPEIRFSGIIHEQILEPILSLGLKIDITRVELKHLGYALEPNMMKMKQLRNLELLDIQLGYHPQDGHALYQRAKTRLALGELDEAENDMSDAIKYIRPNSALRPQALNFGAVIAYQRGEYMTAVWRAIESLKIIAKQAFANFILGESYTELNKFSDALSAYLAAESARQIENKIAHIVGEYYIAPEQLHFRIGRAMLALGRANEAKARFEAGNSANPTDVGCIVGLANIDFRNKQYNAALNKLNIARKLAPDREDIRGFIRQVETQMGSGQPAADKTSAQTPKVQPIQSVSAKPLLTLSMIVKNEEAHLPGCLESVRGSVDEIIVVDTGSTDSTAEIAAAYGAKVVKFDWINDFAAARNEALKFSTGEWILYLDADERLNIYPNQDKFRKMLTEVPDDIGALICTIESEHLQLDGSVEHHRGGYPRIFRNYGYPRIAFQGRVHEQITPSILSIGKSIILSDITIEHLGYNVSREVMEQKIKRNYDMLIKHVSDEPLNAYAWYQLGQTLSHMALFGEAEKAIRFAIELGKLSDSVFASAAATLSQLVGNKRNFDESLLWSEKSLEKAPKQVYAMNLKAYSLLYLGRFEEAEEAFMETLRRIRAKKGVPQSGFDIDIPDSVVLDGLRKAKEKNNK